MGQKNRKPKVTTTAFKDSIMKKTYKIRFHVNLKEAEGEKPRSVLETFLSFFKDRSIFGKKWNPSSSAERDFPSALVRTRQEMLGGDDSCLGPKGGFSKENPFDIVQRIEIQIFYTTDFSFHKITF